MHCFRRAAGRLLTATPSIPKSTWAVASRQSRFVIPQAPRFVLQGRWNSQDARSPATPDVGDEKVVEAAVESTDAQSTVRNDAAGFPQESAEYEEDGKKEARRQLLRKPPTPKDTVFVGNLFFDVTGEEVRAKMEEFGTVLMVNIINDNRGISKGFGYVQFDSVESATNAINGLHDQVFSGRIVTVQFAQNSITRTQRYSRPPTKDVFIGNLPFQMTDRDLNALFEDITNVIDVRVSVDRHSGLNRGFAHAEFTDAESAERAVEILNMKMPLGRKLRLDYSEGRRAAPGRKYEDE